MSTETETTLEEGELGEELFAGIGVTALEVAVITDSSVPRVYSIILESAVVTDSSIGEVSRTLTERAVITSTSTTTKKFRLTTTEVAKLKSSFSGKSVLQALTDESGVLGSELLLGPLFLRSVINEIGTLSDVCTISVRMVRTLSDAGAVASQLVIRPVEQQAEDGPAVFGSSSTTVGKSRITSTNMAAVSASMADRRVHLTRLNAAFIGSSSSSTRKTTRVVSTDSFEGNHYVRTFRA